MKWFKRVVIAVLVVGILAAIAMAMRPKPILVDIAEVTEGAVRVTVDEDGRTRVRDHHIVTAPLYGNLARIELRAGDPVEPDTILARMEPIAPPLLDARTRAETSARLKAAEAARRQADASIARAQASATFASNELQTAKALAAAGNLSRQALDAAQLEAHARAQELRSAKMGAKVARYEREMAKAALAQVENGDTAGQQMEIRAPIGGRVLRIIRQSEGVVQAGAPLLEIADPAAQEIVVDVLTVDAVEIQPGASVRIVRWGGNTELKGRVRLVEPSAFTKISALGVEEQRVNVIIDLDDPPELWSGLGDGFRVEVEITVWERADAIKVPAGALFRRGDGWWTYVMHQDVAQERSVEVGRRSGLEVEITAGLAPGESVILHPTDTIRNDVSVRAR